MTHSKTLNLFLVATAMVFSFTVLAPVVTSANTSPTPVKAQTIKVQTKKTPVKKVVPKKKAKKKGTSKLLAAPLIDPAHPPGGN